MVFTCPQREQGKFWRLHTLPCWRSGLVLFQAQLMQRFGWRQVEQYLAVALPGVVLEIEEGGAGLGLGDVSFIERIDGGDADEGDGNFVGIGKEVENRFGEPFDIVPAAILCSAFQEVGTELGA